MPRNRLDIVDNIAIITFTRSEKLNAFDYEAWREFNNSLKEALKYEGLILTGEGKAFSAGDDIYAMYDLKDYRESKEFFSMVYNVLEKIMYYPHPIVVAVNGLAAGGGAELLLGADYVITVKDAWFWFPEARIGLYPPLLIPLGIYLFGIKKTKRLAISMPRLTPEEALEIGLVDEIIEQEDKLIDIAIKRVKDLNTIPSNSYLYIRRVIANVVFPHIKESLEILSKAVVTDEARMWMEFFIKSKEK